MYINAAYLNNYLPAVVDTSAPLIVTSCGNYRIKTRKAVETKRPSGRNDYQLLYIAAGKARFYINGEEKILHAGNAVLYMPGEPQEYIYLKEDKTDIYWIHFTGSEAGKILKQYIPACIHGFSVTKTDTSPDYRRIFEQIIMELQLCRPCFEELLPLLLRNIFILINRSSVSKNKPNNSMENEIDNAMQHFRANYNKEINVDSYAKSRNFSLSWFIRCFKQITGQTPLQYILSLRISNAQSLLENTDYTISEIAESVGYDNALYFSRLFHKHTGFSPREYKKLTKQTS